MVGQDSLSYLEAIILGLIQALTEFLPVSSSGHLVIGQQLLGVNPEGGAAFEVAVHLGTLLSILVVLRAEIVSLLKGFLPSGDRNELWWQEIKFICLSALPAGLIGVLFKDALEASFSNLKGVGLALCLTGLILLSTKSRQGKRQTLTLRDTLFIGFAQAFAILPGISRSGSTISMALWLGIDRDRAAKLSFLMSLPVVAGAGLLKALDLKDLSLSSQAYLTMGLGAFISFAVGMLALAMLLKWIIKPSFAYFGIYCLFVGSLALFLGL